MKCERAQTLVIVLWIMGLLTVAMGILVGRSTHELRLGSFPLQMVQRQAIAQAAVYQAAGFLKQDDAAVDHLGEAWATGVDSGTQQQLLEGFPLDNGVFSVGSGEGEAHHAGLIDEQRKLNINTATAPQLAHVVEALAPEAPAAELAAAILDWRDEPAGDYCKGLLPCHNAPFDTLDELRLVPGMTPAIFDALAPELTVYGTGLVNVNTASVAVLDAIGGQGEAWVEQRMSQPFASSPDSGIANLGVISTHFTVPVQATLTQGQAVTRLEAVIDRDGTILSWQPQP